MTQQTLKLILLTALALGLLSSLADAQNKRDSLKFDSSEVRLIYRNAQIIQQNLHTLHLDAVLRDKLDSIFYQSATLLDGKLKPKIKKGSGK